MDDLRAPRDHAKGGVVDDGIVEWVVQAGWATVVDGV